MKYKDIKFPIVPYLELELAGKTFNCMDYITEASIEIIGDFYLGVSKAEVIIYDPSAIEIEKLLLKNREVKLKYGLVDASGNVYSQTFIGFAINYTPTIKPEGIGISINLTLNGWNELLKEDKQRSFNDEISSIVKQIAEENGLKADVDKTDVKGIFRQLNQTDFEFIKDVLLMKANSNQNDSPFFFWIEGDTLYFKQVNSSKPKYKFILPDTEESTAPVISFSPQNNLIAGMLAGEEIKVKKLNPLTKEYEEEEVKNETMDKRQVLGEKKVKTGTKRIRVASHANPKNEEIARYKRIWGYLSDYPVTAELEILGHPFINPQEKAEVLVYLIDNKTKKQTLYHNSGVYIINKVIHSISTGSFKTNLEMIKNAGIEGQEEAKGIVNKQNF